MRSALSQWRSMRTASVLTPRSVRSSRAGRGRRRASSGGSAGARPSPDRSCRRSHRRRRSGRRCTSWSSARRCRHRARAAAAGTGSRSVVDDEQAADVVRRVCDRADVEHLQERVRRRLDPDHVGPLRRDLGEPDRRREIRVGEAVALRSEHLREEPVGAAVHVVHRHRKLARRDELEHRGDRGHARGEGEAVLGLLERRQALLERGARQVVVRA